MKKALDLMYNTESELNLKMKRGVNAEGITGLFAPYTPNRLIYKARLHRSSIRPQIPVLGRRLNKLIRRTERTRRPGSHHYFPS